MEKVTINRLKYVQTTKFCLLTTETGREKWSINEIAQPVDKKEIEFKADQIGRERQAGVHTTNLMGTKSEV